MLKTKTYISVLWISKIAQTPISIRRFFGQIQWFISPEKEKKQATSM